MTEVKPDPPADAAQPALHEVQQLEVPTYVGSVPVRVDGPLQVQLLPNRRSFAQTYALTTTTDRVLSEDLRRARAWIIGDAAWYYRHSQTGEACPIPANVGVPVGHSGEVWAKAATTANLTVIAEWYAD